MSTHKIFFSGKRGNEERVLNESNSITRIGGRASGPPPTTAVTTPLLLELEEEDDDEEELELGDDVEIPPPPPPEAFGFGDERAGVPRGGLLGLKLFTGGFGIGIFGL